MSAPEPTFQTPSSVLIVGSGVFGLSTAYSLAQDPSFANTTITVLDRSTFPAPDGSSIDSSRIIRPDYSDPAYSKLANEAQSLWRKQGAGELGGEGRYSEAGLLLVADEGAQGMNYVRHSFENVSKIMAERSDREGVVELSGRSAIEEEFAVGGGCGDWGYISRRSGWANAEAAMVWLRERVEATGRVRFLVAEVSALKYSSSSSRKVVGVHLKDMSSLEADLTVLATGAWTPKLVDLRGRAHSTGQVLCYLHLTDAEQEKLKNIPVLLNMSTGLFVIPPQNKVLKIARHAYGYSNPVSIPNPSNPSQNITVSLPRTGVDDPKQLAPAEGEADCRAFLGQVIPQLKDREFYHSRICWYTDTPKGDFIMTYHPDFEGLFLATGGSGHGFKFLPVIGDKIVDCIRGNCPEEFREKWAWPKETVENVVTEDGSRGGKPGSILMEEMAKPRL